MRLSVSASVAAVFIAGSILLMFALATSYTAARDIVVQPQPIGSPVVSVIGSPIGSAGTSFDVYGNGWPPNQIVFVYLGNLDRLDDRQVIFSGETDAQGSFVLRAPCTTDPHWSAMSAVAVIVQSRDQSIEVATHVPVNPAGAAANSLAAQPLPTDTAVPTPAPTDAPPAPFTPTPTPSPTVVPPTVAPTQVPAETVTPTPLSPGNAFPDWKGEYFDNTTLSGLPLRVVNDAQIDFTWGSDTPKEFVPADGFSVRWTRKPNIPESATYRFMLAVDDGARVFVDGNVVIDQWRGATPGETYSTDVILTAGYHELRVEMVEQSGEASIEFSYAPLVIYKGWKGEYFANSDPNGTPVHTRDDEVLNFNWGNGTPHEDVPADDFSVRWTRTISFEQAAVYTFLAQADDGVRIRVDDTDWLINYWDSAQPITHTASVNLAAGWHTVVVEYKENKGDASVAFVYRPPVAEGHWTGEYFKNRDLSGLPMWIRADSDLIFNWGYDQPAPGTLTLIDHFSARWTRSVNIDKDKEGRYRFSITADDGARFFIDNHLVLDEWHKSNSETYSIMVDLDARSHEFRVEYYEHDGRARIMLEDWTRVSGIPPTAPAPTPTSPPAPTLTPTP